MPSHIYQETADVEPCYDSAGTIDSAFIWDNAGKMSFGALSRGEGWKETFYFQCGMQNILLRTQCKKNYYSLLEKNVIR